MTAPRCPAALDGLPLQPPTTVDSTNTPMLSLLCHEDQRVDWTQARAELQRLHAIERWALAQQPFQVGDRVRIHADYRVPQWLAGGTQHGWWASREVLHPGALATVERVDFNWVWLYWHADITLDREWWTDAQGVQHERAASDRHQWGFAMRWLERVETES